MQPGNRVYLADDRQSFSIIYHELWDYYLPMIGPAATLLYCYLLRLVKHGLSGPGGSGWQAEICGPLGMTLNESYQAWARLQEFGLVIAQSDGSYALTSPKAKDDFQAAFADATPLQQQLKPVSSEAQIRTEALMRGQRRSRAQKSMLSIVEQEFGRALSTTEMDKLLVLEKAYARDLLELAVEIAVINQARNLSYIEQILINWRLKGITSAQAARQDAAEHRMQKARRRSGKRTESSAKQSDSELQELLNDVRLYRALPPKEE
ncbi:MAG: DnaD domain-containing protein [Bacillota bacterium]|jgi:DnaD/phage-associated family protein